jgi:imidazolonepropionase-like amidohydrolase
MRFFITILIVAFQQIAVAQSQEFYLTGATVHIGNGEVFENGLVKVLDGKIEMVVDARVVKIDLSDKKVINVYGKHIYPGIIAMNTRLGLEEIEEVNATLDFEEFGDFTPNIRSSIAYNTDSEVLATIKSNGVLYAQVVPEGGLISGSSSVLKTNAWNWEDALVKAEDGIHLWWPSRFSRGGWWAEPGELKENESYTNKINEISSFLGEAKAYLGAAQKVKNIKFEATKALFEGTQNLYVHVNKAKEMIDAISMAEKVGIQKVVIVGGLEAPEIATLLKEKNIPVIIGDIHTLPSNEHSDVDAHYKLPAALQKTGVQYCISYKESWEQRNLVFVAGTAAAYGLTKEEALSAITKNAADILGLSNIGSLETGKNASFVIASGDILDMRTSVVEQAFIDGVEIELGDKQKKLYEKYIEKYKNEGKL